jgi:hypothetical protein
MPKTVKLSIPEYLATLATGVNREDVSAEIKYETQATADALNEGMSVVMLYFYDDGSVHREFTTNK